MPILVSLFAPFEEWFFFLPLTMQFLLLAILVLGRAIADSNPDESVRSDSDVSNASPIDPNQESMNNLIVANPSSLGLLSADPDVTDPALDASLSSLPPISDDLPPVWLSSVAGAAPSKPSCYWFFWPVCCTGEIIDRVGRNFKKISECWNCMRLSDSLSIICASTSLRYT